MPGMRLPTPTADGPRLPVPGPPGKEPQSPALGGPTGDLTRMPLGPGALLSPAASSTPSPKITTPTPPLGKMEQPGMLDPAAMAELIKNTEVKQELIEGGIKAGEF